MLRTYVQPLVMTFGILLAGLAPSANAASYQQLYAFQGQPDGSAPIAAVLPVGGTFYGTTETGGVGNGTIYALDSTTGKETTLYAFKNGIDGIFPQDKLLKIGSHLYGTTFFGGASTHCSVSGCGTAYSYDLTTGVEKVLHSFQNGGDGANPSSALILVGGLLYGTTSGDDGQVDCSKTGCGTVFSIDPVTGAEHVLHAFTGADGSAPAAGLQQLGSLLYGTTALGGAHGDGTIFAIESTTGVETVVHAFAGRDGKYPAAALTVAGGTVYGTTTKGGGAGGRGTVFSFNPTTRAEVVLHTFTGGLDGGDPVGAVTQFGGVLYGTTEVGGASAICGLSKCGTVFSLEPATRVKTILHAFQGGTDGAFPASRLVAVGTTLVGTTEIGGTGCSGSGCGTVFAITP